MSVSEIHLTKKLVSFFKNHDLSEYLDLLNEDEYYFKKILDEDFIQVTSLKEERKLFSIDDFCIDDYKTKYQLAWENFWFMINKIPSNNLTSEQYKKRNKNGK